jgi:hypothetical protein
VQRSVEYGHFNSVGTDANRTIRCLIALMVLLRPTGDRADGRDFGTPDLTTTRKQRCPLPLCISGIPCIKGKGQWPARAQSRDSAKGYPLSRPVQVVSRRQHFPRFVLAATFSPTQFQLHPRLSSRLRQWMVGRHARRGPFVMPVEGPGSVPGLVNPSPRDRGQRCKTRRYCLSVPRHIQQRRLPVRT